MEPLIDDQAGRVVHSFPPVSRRDARFLILGSMPGRASVEAAQYYAHPRNQFWPIMARIVGLDPTAGYRARLADLVRAQIALWDVLARCTRESSLDSDIVESSIVPNPIGELLDTHPSIRAICFNGAKAEQVYRRHVLPYLPEAARAVPCVRLPSTSPAHQTLGFEAKLTQWRAALGRPE